MHVGNRQFPLADATLLSAVQANDVARWTSTSLSWSAGDTVQLSLTAPVNPSGVELAGSDLDTSGGGFDLAVTEGASGAFTVRLSSDPGANTTVRVKLVKAQYNQSGFGKSGHVWDVNAASVSPETLTFTGGNSGNFGAPQTVNVTGVEDDDVRPEQLIILLFGVGPGGANFRVGGAGNASHGRLRHRRRQRRLPGHRRRTGPHPHPRAQGQQPRKRRGPSSSRRTWA